MTQVDIDTLNTFLTLIAILGSVAGSWAVTSYRIGRLEKDRKEDKDAFITERDSYRKSQQMEKVRDVENFQRLASDLSAEIKALDGRVREHTGNLYEGLDDIRGAGGILESRVSALETTMEPGKVHEFNQWRGQISSELSRAKEDVRRVEEHLLQEVRRNADACKACASKKE